MEHQLLPLAESLSASATVEDSIFDLVLPVWDWFHL